MAGADGPGRDGDLPEALERPAFGGLRGEASRYRLLLEQANVAVFLADAETGRLVYANRRAQKLVGRTLDEITAMHQHDLHPPGEAERYEAIFREHAGAEDLARADGEVLTWDGTLVPVEITASVVEVDGRKVVQGVFHDLSRLHEAHRALEETAHRYRQLVELSPDAIVVLHNGLIVFANPTALRLLGASGPDDLLGRPVLELVHPDFRGQVRRRAEAMLETGAPAPMVASRLLRLDGSVIEVEEAAGPLTYRGEAAVQVVFRDISERQRMQAELERSQAQQAAILSSLPVAIYSACVPSEQDATWMSASVERFTGYPARRVVDEPRFWTDRIHPEDRDRVIAEFRHDIGQGQARISYRFRVADGSYRWLDEQARAVATRDGRTEVIGFVADVSEARRAEEALRQSEEKYRSLVEEVLEAIFLLDESGTISFISPAIERITGYSPEEVLGRGFATYIWPEDLPELQADFRHVLEGNLHPSEYRVRCKAGGTRWVRSSSRPVLDGDRVVGLRGVLVDITERREAEVALQNYARRLESMHQVDLAILAARSPREIAATVLRTLRQLTAAERAAIVVFDADTAEGEYVAVDAEPGLEQPAGGRVPIEYFLPVEGGAGGTLYIRDLAVHPEQPPLVATLSTRGVRSMLVSTFSIEKGPVARLVLSSRREDAFSPEDQQVAREVAGELGVVLHQARLRERLEEQQRTLALLVSQIPDGIVLLGPHGRLDLANPAAVDYLAALGHEDVRLPLHRLGGAPLETLMLPRPGDLPHELQGVSSDARRFEVRVRPTVGGPGPAWIMLIHDATREHLMARSLEQQDRLAVIGQLAGGLAHDFNNYLSAILTHAELLLRDPAHGVETREALRVIKEQSERSARLVRSILDFSRGSSPERYSLDLCHFVRDLGEILARTIPERIRLEVAVRHDEPCPVLADATRLQQVVMNIAVNARDAMPGQGSLRVGVQPLELAPEATPPVAGMQPGPWVHLFMQDSGTGIRPEHLPHVFEPFFTTKPHGHGTGLGLSQVYGLVRQHQGYVAAESEWGQGTTIHIYLPRHSGPWTGESAADSGLVMGTGETVLLAEDEPEVRAALQQALLALGYQVVAVANGREALEHLQGGGRAHLLLTDLTMPVMGGEELVAAVSGLQPSLPVVVLTGYAAGHGDSLQGQRIAAMVQKPLALADLARVVRDAIRGVGRPG